MAQGNFLQSLNVLKKLNQINLTDEPGFDTRSSNDLLPSIGLRIRPLQQSDGGRAETSEERRFRGNP